MASLSSILLQIATSLLEYEQHSCRHHLYVIIVSHVQLHCGYFGMHKLGINVVDMHPLKQSVSPPFVIFHSTQLSLVLIFLHS